MRRGALWLDLHRRGGEAVTGRPICAMLNTLAEIQGGPHPFHPMGALTVEQVALSFLQHRGSSILSPDGEIFYTTQRLAG